LVPSQRILGTALFLEYKFGVKAADLIRSDHEELLRRINASILQQAPHLARTVSSAGDELRDLRREVLDLSVSGLADYLDFYPQDPAGVADGFRLHRDLGRLEARAGRPLTDVLRAPWAASSTIWRYAVSRAERGGIPPHEMHVLADAVITWSDRLSGAFSEGYNDETAVRSAENEGHRQRLAARLLSDEVIDPSSLRRLAEEATWTPTPGRVRVLLASGDDRHGLRGQLPRESLVCDIDARLTAFVPEGRQDAVLALSGSSLGSVLGPAVDLQDARHSAAVARSVLQLVNDGVAPIASVVDSDRYDLEVVLLHHWRTADRLVSRLLGPLEGHRELLETLAAWLRHHGRPKATGADLGVHPHTVTYRLDRIRELLGPLPDDPERHTELVVAVAIALRRISRPAGSG
jgi:hypothetical protein